MTDPGKISVPRVLLFCGWIAIVACPVALAKGELNARQARKLLANIPGFSLKMSAVHVKTIRPVNATTFEANAEIVTAFRLEGNSVGQWRVADYRTGQDQWQDIELITRALKVTPNQRTCQGPELAVSRNTVSDPTVKRARCLLADLLGIQLPSDDLRIKSVSPMTLPFSSKPSALVEASVAGNFRFQKETKGSWRVVGIKTGNREWVDPEVILRAVNMEKVANARSDLESIVKALEKFRDQRGFYVEAKSEAVLIDFLSPRYLSRVIRLDPWRRPYRYEGTRDHFTLRSLGPDGQENTSDDIVLIGPTRSAASQNSPR